jgi:hypothetical protein
MQEKGLYLQNKFSHPLDVLKPRALTWCGGSLVPQGAVAILSVGGPCAHFTSPSYSAE